ncbi:hypothetical protein Misp06_03847 [Microbulbifer sp. NBRC 101763]|uniref:hypothetical protein n=1 Tax=Microbulbifer TaxID=48073 RepID=UPI000370EB6C|nr:MULTISPECIES: hypothetical protein [Microbulbifer]WHI50664.1 hypothetical protein P3339_19875 [Microbulbifer sp. MLAF003]
MSVGAWEPQVNGQQEESHWEFNRDQLQRFIAATVIDSPLAETINEEDQQASQLIRLPAQQWLEQSQHWNNDQLWQLIRFFTLAEMQLAGWDAGAESAVIPLAKVLRQRKAALSREQLLWIRQHSDNRYLPYGPL